MQVKKRYTLGFLIRAMIGFVVSVIVACSSGGGNPDVAETLSVYLDSETAYSWRVRAANSTDVGQWSSEAEFTVAASTETSDTATSSTVLKCPDAGVQFCLNGDYNDKLFSDDPNTVGASEVDVSGLASVYDLKTDVQADSGNPVFTWDPEQNATGYEIVILESISKKELSRKIVSSSLNCSEDRCSIESRSPVVDIANIPPVAAVDQSFIVGQIPLAVTLSGAASYDSDGQIVEHRWNVDGRFIDYPNSAEFSYTFDEVGTYAVSLVVRDDKDRTSESTAEINVTASAAIGTSVTPGLDISLAQMQILSQQTAAASAEPSLGPAAEQETSPSPLVIDPVETTPVETTPVETTPVETTPVETTPVETTPVETTPVETTPVETTPVETTPVETTPVETTPVETTPVETTPVETTPVETTPVETTPVETTPVETTPVETTPVETTPVETTPTVEPELNLGGAIPQSTFPDTEYGDTQIAANGGNCPNIPTSFAKSTVVSSQAAFDAAYRSANPGDAIIIKNGSYSWSVPAASPKMRGISRPYLLNRPGTAENKIYILAETVAGVTMSGFGFDWVMSAPHNVLAGFRMTGSKSLITAPDNRWACNYKGPSVSALFIEGPNSDRVEVDNNIFDGSTNVAIAAMRCNPIGSTCTNNSIDGHVHHNVFKNMPPAGINGREAMSLGLGYDPLPDVTIYSVEKARGTWMGWVVENNLFDGWNGENELITIKSSGNIIRNNCVINANQANFTPRNGSYNLITGNWIEGSGGGFEISGRHNWIVFNYHSNGSNGYVVRFRAGEKFTGVHGTVGNYAYTPSSDSEISNNVFSKVTHWGQQQGIAIGSNNLTGEWPDGNSMKNNHAYSKNSKLGWDTSIASRTEAVMLASNPNIDPIQVMGSPLPSSVCGNAALFNGPGGPGASMQGDSDLKGAPSVINAPSWW